MHSARLLIAALLLAVGLTAHAQDNPRVRVETNMGKFVIELDPARAPLTVANFLEYMRAGHYNGTIFHRVIANFVAQGGGYDEKNVEKPTRDEHPQRIRQRPVEPPRHGRACAHGRPSQRQRAVLHQLRGQRRARSAAEPLGLCGVRPRRGRDERPR